MWCGFISVMAVENAVKWFDADFRLIGSHAHSGLVYATTLMQGVMLSLTLFFFVGATWAVLFLLQHLRARNQK